MAEQESNTQKAILEAGKKEFLTYGYENASLRRIAAKASVTTGAIYGYFPGKEALFDAIVSGAADGLLEKYKKVHKDFSLLSPKEQAEVLMEVTDQKIPEMVHYIYDHMEEFKILFCCCSSGYYESYISQLTAIEEKACWDFMKSMKSLGHCVPDMDDTLIHILSRSFFQQLWEFVAHDVPRDRAVAYSMLLGRFQHAGWEEILGL